MGRRNYFLCFHTMSQWTTANVAFITFDLLLNPTVSAADIYSLTQKRKKTGIKNERQLSDSWPPSYQISSE